MAKAMIIFLLVLILLAILVPGLLRGVFGLIGLVVLVFTLTAMFADKGHPETWRKDSYGSETWRSDKGQVWKKDRYGYETWRSNTGEVCKKDRYGGAVRCSK